jgi:hypothetical protein
MSALVGRVARAICETSNAEAWRELGWTEAGIERLLDENWQEYVPEAEAAIAVVEEVMRERTAQPCIKLPGAVAGVVEIQGGVVSG